MVFHGIAAGGTGFGLGPAGPGRGGTGSASDLDPGLVIGPAAAGAFNIGLTPAHGNHGDKKDAQIVVPAHQTRAGQPAGRAGPGVVIQLDLLGLHTADKNEDPPPASGRTG